MEDGKHDSEVLDRAQIILQILSNKMTLHQQLVYLMFLLKISVYGRKSSLTVGSRR